MLAETENLGIEQVKRILSKEISDWIRWGRNRDYLPPSFKCPLGFLYLPKRGDLDVGRYKLPPIDLLAVVEFERMVMALPSKHRQAFVMYHLDRAKVNEKIIERKRKPYEMAQLLGVQKRQFHNLVAQAHNMVFRDWKAKQGI